MSCITLFSQSQDCGGLNYTYSIDGAILKVLGQSAAGNTAKYYWTFGNGSSSDGREGKAQYEKSGEYEVCLKVITDNCTSSLCRKIKISLPTIDSCKLQADYEVKVDGMTGIFVAKSNDDKTKFQWSVTGSNKIYEGREIKIPFEKPGIYEVCVKAFTSENCKVQVCKRVEIKDVCNLVADYSYTIDGNILRVLAKTNSDNTLKYYWSFGNGISAEGQEAKNLFTKSGEYEVCLRVLKPSLATSVSQICTASICKKIKIESPILDSCQLKVDYEVRVDGMTGIFVAKSNDDRTKYLWTITGSTKQYEGREVKIPFEKAGIYEVCNKAYTSESCKVQICKKVEIKEICGLVADFSYTIDGNILRVMGKSNADGVKYSWSFGNGKSSEGVESKVEYEKAGEYEVCLKVYNNTCVVPVCKKIKINIIQVDTCSLKIDYDFKVDGMTGIFVAKSNDDKAKYQWNVTGTNKIYEGRETKIPFEKAGTYEVCLKSFTSETCKVQICKKVEIRDNCNLIADYTFTLDGNILRVLGKANDNSAVKYSWSFGNGVSADGREAKVQYEKTGVYEVCLKVYLPSTASNINTCVQSICKKITVGNLDTICNLSQEFTYRLDGNTVVLVAKSSDPKAKYYWYIGGINKELIGREVKYTFDKAAAYEICLTVVNEKETCKEKICKTISIGNRVNIFPNPTSDFIKIAVESEVSRVTIYNHINEMMVATNIKDTTGDIDISHLKDGLYIMQIQLSNGQTETKRFFKK